MAAIGYFIFAKCNLIFYAISALKLPFLFLLQFHNAWLHEFALAIQAAILLEIWNLWCKREAKCNIWHFEILLNYSSQFRKTSGFYVNEITDCVLCWPSIKTYFTETWVHEKYWSKFWRCKIVLTTGRVGRLGNNIMWWIKAVVVCPTTTKSARFSAGSI